MKLTFSKKLHMNRTIRFIDIIADETIDNNYNATLVYIPTMREYVTIDYTRGIDTDLIVGIRYVANCHIQQASTVTLDFNNEYGNRYYHFTDSANNYYNFNDVVPFEHYQEYAEFIYRLIALMDNYQ